MASEAKKGEKMQNKTGQKHVEYEKKIYITEGDQEGRNDDDEEDDDDDDL